MALQRLAKAGHFLSVAAPPCGPYGTCKSKEPPVSIGIEPPWIRSNRMNEYLAVVYDTKPYDREYLQRANEPHGVSLRFEEFRLSSSSAETARGAQAVCVFVNDQLDRLCLKTLAGLGVRHIALRCAGFNNVDLQAACDFGLAVTRVPAYSPNAVAEHAVALLLTLNRKIHRAHNRVREHNFSLNGLVGFDLCGKTVGIIGTGKIGKVTAEILRGFGSQVIAYDPFPAPSWASRHSINYTELEMVLSRSDVISLHLPLSPETFHLIDAKALSKLKHGAFIINTSRGKLIDTRALIDALKRGSLGGVALDVYEEEEGVFFEDLSEQVLLDDELSRLITFPNVLITAHQAYLTREALSEIGRVTIENICRGGGNRPFLPDTVLQP
jgi:D-lactate dehydrogenase